MHQSLCYCLSCCLLVILTSCAINELPDATVSAKNYSVYPPFSKNKKFIISQAFNDWRSHKGEFNAYAVDLAMPYGEPVCAALSGVVESYNDADQPMPEDKRFREDNYVRILHTDKTWGLYAHLAPGSITIKPKQRVKQGDCFAKVGKTGYSTGPHLHFALLRLLPDRFISVPFRFVQPDGQVIEPKLLRWVTN